jgi:HPt (histidine-containing phosphotransfer) domain-containing protein
VLRKEGAFGRETMCQIQENKMEANMEVIEKLYDLNQLQEIAGDNHDFLTALAQIYLDTIPQTSSEMVQATKDGDWDKASKRAHKLKSTVDSLNMHLISKDVRSIEIDAKNRVNTESIKMLALKVDKIIKIVAGQLKDDFSL